MNPSSSHASFVNLCLFSPSGALLDENLLNRAVHQLQELGFKVTEMPQTRLRHQRFAGDENARLESLQQAFKEISPAVLMATRGGYGLSRLLHQLDFQALANDLNRGQHLMSGHSDVTGLQLALLASGAQPDRLLHGPMACFDFGSEQGANPTTVEHFLNAVHCRRVDIEWNSKFHCQDVTQHETQLKGPVWGGNLTLVCSLLGTPWMPNIQGGILVLEDINEPAYKIERMLLQLLHAGVLQQQQALLLGNFSEPSPGAHDNGFDLQATACFLRAQLPALPVLMGFPFGHCTPKACWFQGLNGQLTINWNGKLRLQQAVDYPG